MVCEESEQMKQRGGKSDSARFLKRERRHSKRAVPRAGWKGSTKNCQISGIVSRARRPKELVFTGTRRQPMTRRRSVSAATSTAARASSTTEGGRNAKPTANI